MINFSLKGKFRGKELWRSVNLILFFIVYTVMFIVPMAYPEYTWTIIVVIAFIGVSYMGIQQYVYRKMENKNAGRRVLYGWIDQEEDLGEEYEIPIAKTTPFERLSIDDQISVDKFMEIEKQRIESLLIPQDILQAKLIGNSEFVTSEKKEEKK